MDTILWNANAECEVSVQLSQQGAKGVDCAISVKNLSDRDLYMFDRCYDQLTPEARPDYDKAVFYSWLDGGNRLILFKGIDAPPPDLNVESMVYPACTKIQAFGRHEDHLTIALPVRLYAPYRSPGSQVQGASPLVVFRFGYFLGHEATASMEIKVPSKEGELIAFDPFDHNFQKIIEVGPFQPLPIAQ
ncbi:MAG: hypothetical protein KA791_03100 [Flavobacteriales bacterium]|nr:hypothetical protein [Flavobacteriales bacterium]